MKCQTCDAHAVYKKDKYLCKTHFFSYIEHKVLSTIKDYNLFNKESKILVAGSGGKDSTTIAYILSKNFPNVEILSIDEGNEGYRNLSIDDLKKFCTDNRIKLNIHSFKEAFGFSLQEIPESLRVCTTCGILRRHVLNRFAAGFDVLVTGHNLDDEAQSILMNLCKANTDCLARLGPISGVIRHKGFVPRVKPLYFCEEREIKAYSFLKQFPVVHRSCPYSHTSFRSIIRNQLNAYEQSNPGAKERFVSNFVSLLPRLKQANTPKGAIKQCVICKAPSSKEKCAACSLSEQICKSIKN